MAFPLHPTIKLSHLSPKVDPFVKVFIVSDSLFYSALNFVTPLFALFVTLDVVGGTIQTAAYALTISFVARILSELTISRLISRLNENKKIITVIVSLLLITAAYFAFALAREIMQLYIIWAVIGFAQGIAFPAKLSLFSRHLDKNKEATEWGVSDALNMSLIALVTALGGYIAAKYGFSLLFLLASFTSLLGVLPYFLYYLRYKKSSNKSSAKRIRYSK